MFGKMIILRQGYNAICKMFGKMIILRQGYNAIGQHRAPEQQSHN